MAWQDLRGFVEKGLASGISRERIAAALEEAGWPRRQVGAALDSYSPSDLPIAVPRAAITPSAHELFLYLSVFSSLYMAIMGLGSIVYQLINLAFPDPADSISFGIWSSNPESRLRSGVATVAVFLPAYLMLDHRIEALKRSDPGQIGSDIRRKVTYLTLYFTAFVLLYDLVYLIDSWLSGELGRRVAFKCLTVALLASLVLNRYLFEMSADEHLQPARAGFKRRGSLVFLCAAALAAVIAALQNVPSPGKERERQVDRTRETALERIDRSITSYYEVFRKLPASLDDLGRAQHVKFPRDPETARPYRYEVTGKDTYRLCSSFHAARTEEQLLMEGGPYASAYPSSTFAEHGAGEQCFDKETAQPRPPRQRGEAAAVPINDGGSLPAEE